MPFIETPATSDLYAADEAAFGFVPNFTRVFAHRPAVYAAWKALNGAVKAELDPRRYELVTLAAAQGLRSSYCAIAHGKILAERWFSPDELVAVVDDRSSALDEVDAAVMELAERVAVDATAVTQADVDRLRGLGLGDAEILDVVLAAAMRSFFSKTLDALGLQPDAEYRALLGDELREALTVGRPVAEAG